MAPDIQLRPHPKEAVAASTATLRDHARASVIAACGTGKTLIAARTTARIAPRGRVLVLLPTLDLLSQTIRSWRLAGRKGTAIAVCSQRQALDHEPLGADSGDGLQSAFPDLPAHGLVSTPFRLCELEVPVRLGGSGLGES